MEEKGTFEQLQELREQATQILGDCSSQSAVEAVEDVIEAIDQAIIKVIG